MELHLVKKAGRVAARAASPFLWARFWSKAPRVPDGFWKGKKAALTVSFDLDYPDDVAEIPRLLEALRVRKVRTSFAIVGKFFENDKTQASNREKLKAVARAGHELINHSYTHPNGYFNPNVYFNDLPLGVQEWEIKKCHDVVRKVTGVRMAGFRTPHFGDLHQASIYPLLRRLGYAYSSSTMATRVGRALPFNPPAPASRGTANGKLLELPVMTCPAHFYPVFDSYHCFRSHGGAHANPGEFLTQFKRAVRMAVRHGAYANFYFDPMDIAQKPDFALALDWLASLRDSGDVWVAPSRDVARHWAGQKEAV